MSELTEEQRFNSLKARNKLEIANFFFENIPLEHYIKILHNELNEYKEFKTQISVSFETEKSGDLIITLEYNPYNTEDYTNLIKESYTEWYTKHEQGEYSESI